LDEILAAPPTVALKVMAELSYCRSNCRPVAAADWDAKVTGSRRLAPGGPVMLGRESCAALAAVNAAKTRTNGHG
jgi:hypothetical protein